MGKQIGKADMFAPQVNLRELQVHTFRHGK